MSCWQIAIALMAGAGMALTLIGSIALFVGARRRYREARRQLSHALELNNEEAKECAGVTDPDEIQKIYERYLGLHEANGLPRPAGYGHSYQPGYESVNIMRALGAGAARDLVIAAAGVFLSGMASVLGALFLTA